MKTIKIIDLLNKIANGEKTPEKIKYQNKIFTHNGFGNNNYWCEEKNVIFEESFILEDLNNEIEIIEEKKEIEKCDVLKHCVDFTKNENVLLDNQFVLQKKIDDLIDVVNELKTEK